MMKTYVKKPVKIQAFEFDGTIQSLIDNLPLEDMHNFWNTFPISGNGHDEKVRVNEIASSDDESDELLFRNTDMKYFNQFSGKSIYIDTLEGPLKASKGDYIIRGIRGEYYSCKPDVFKQTYDEVE